jgi:hypothetical protein
MEIPPLLRATRPIPQIPIAGPSIEKNVLMHPPVNIGEQGVVPWGGPALAPTPGFRQTAILESAPVGKARIEQQARAGIDEMQRQTVIRRVAREKVSFPQRPGMIDPSATPQMRFGPVQKPQLPLEARRMQETVRLAAPNWKYPVGPSVVVDNPYIGRGAAALRRQETKFPSIKVPHEMHASAIGHGRSVTKGR